MSEIENQDSDRGQASMFDLDSRQFNPNWVDEHQPLQIFKNPLHWKAHKLQILIARLDKQAQNNPAQFNSRNYIDALCEFEKCMDKINGAFDDDEDLDEGGMDQSRHAETTPRVGAPVAVGLDSGISADNPLAG